MVLLFFYLLFLAWRLDAFFLTLSSDHIVNCTGTIIHPAVVCCPVTCLCPLLQINAVRAIVPNKSNNEIILVLQHFDNCVDKTVQAFMEGNASSLSVDSGTWAAAQSPDGAAYCGLLLARVLLSFPSYRKLEEMLRKLLCCQICSPPPQIKKLCSWQTVGFEWNWIK